MTLSEAHKTGRKYRRKSDALNCKMEYYRFTICDHPLNAISVEIAIADDWEVEPELYEVECTWERSNGRTYPCSCGDQRFSEGFGKSLLKKRTKLTIEVLD